MFFIPKGIEMTLSHNTVKVSVLFYILYLAMLIRKFKQKKILNSKVIIWFFILCVWVYFLMRLITSVFGRLSHSTQIDMPTLWASLVFSGKISVDNNFPSYTHSLIDPNGNKIWLKSSTINLNSYTDVKIVLVWRVKKYFKTTPILEVDTIKLPDQNVIVTNNTYFFVKDLVYLDLSAQAQLSAVKSWNDIQILFNDNSVIHIERFVCSKILKSRNCTYLITDYIKNHKDSFESYRWYTFYKHWTGFWTTFDDNMFGFMFKDISDDMVLDISNMFKIVNKDFIIKNKLPLIQSHCRNDTTLLYSIDSEGGLVYQNPYLINLTLNGNDKKNNPVTCKITFDVRNNWDVKNAEFSVKN